MDNNTSVVDDGCNGRDLKVHGIRSRDVKGRFTVRRVWRKRFMSTSVVFRWEVYLAEEICFLTIAVEFEHDGRELAYR